MFALKNATNAQTEHLKQRVNMSNQTIIIYCSDPRSEKANLWKTIKSCLIPPNDWWVPIALLGGPISLANPTKLPLDFAFLMGQIEFAMSQFPIKKFVVIGHDCGYYERISHRKTTIKRKRNDVARAAKLLKRRFKMPVEGFFRNDNGGFDKVF